MGKMRWKRTLSILLALALALTIIPAGAMTAWAEDTDEADDIPEFVPGVIPEEEGIVYDPPSTGRRGAPRGPSYTDTLPASYDSRDYGFQTSVKNQGPNAICWTFGSYAALEAQMLKNGFAAQDFSELHMAYSLSNYNSNAAEGYNRAPSGGNRSYVGEYLMRGTGLSGTVDESGAPYVSGGLSYSSSAMPDTPAVGFNGLKTMSKSYAVRNMYFVTSGSYLENSTSHDKIKRAILDYGGVGASMYWDGTATADAAGTRSTTYFNSTTGAYYYDGDIIKESHLVEIVGWDDNYAVTNFNSGRQPSNSGAWIVKNSWGTSWGKNGYCYISYEDKSFPLSVFCFDGVQPYDTDSKVYQGDYKMSGGTSIAASSSTASYYARVFTATRVGEQLQSVKVFLGSAGATAKIAAVENYNGTLPTTFTANGSVTGTYPGWYTIDFDTPVALTKDQQFAVIVQLTGGRYIGRDSNTAIPSGSPVFYAGGDASSVTSSWNTYNANICLKAVTVTSADTAAVAAAKAALTWDVIKGEKNTQAEVRTDLILPSASVQGTQIEWTTSDAAVLDAAGKVTRMSGDSNVTLTATIKRGNASGTVVFNLTVKGVPEADKTKAAAIRQITWDDIKGENGNQNAVDKNLSLISSLTDGEVTAEVTWAVSDNLWVTADGAVTQPGPSYENQTATLTPTVHVGEAAYTQTGITIGLRSKTVGESTAAELMALADPYARNIAYVWNLVKKDNVGTYNEVRTDLNMKPVSPLDFFSLSLTPHDDGANSNLELVYIDGRVTRPPYPQNDQRVTFSANYFVGNSGAAREHTFTVLAYKGTIKIDEQPTATTTVIQNNTATLTCAASADAGAPGEIEYQWYRKDGGTSTAIQGATDSEFQIPTGTTGTFTYYCVASALDGAPVTSDNAVVTVQSGSYDLQITKVDPVDNLDHGTVDVKEGESTPITITLTNSGSAGTGPLSIASTSRYPDHPEYASAQTYTYIAPSVLSVDNIHAGGTFTFTVALRQGETPAQINEAIIKIEGTADNANINLQVVVQINWSRATVSGVTVSPETESVAKGGSQHFTASVLSGNGGVPPQDVTWTVAGNNAAGTGIDSTGLLTVAANETAETLTVTATSTRNTGKSGTATVTITAAPTSDTPTPPEPEKQPQSSFGFETAAQAKTVGDADFAVTAIGAASGSTVTYSSSDSAVATVDSSTGTVHIVGAGTATITATASETESDQAATASYTLTVSERPAPGEPSIPAWTYPTPTPSPAPAPSAVTPVTITVSSESDSLPIRAAVSDGIATVSALTDRDISKIVISAEPVEDVVLDFSGLSADVTTVEIPSATFVNLADALAQHAGSDTLTIRTRVGEVLFDETSVRSIAEQVTNGNVSLAFESIGAEKLNAAQRSALRGKELAGCYELTLAVSGKAISGFGGGTVTLVIPLTPAEGKEGRYYQAYYAAEDGSVERMPTSFADNALSFTTTHFSDYVLAYEVRPFADVAETWYYDAVYYCYDNGYFQGVGSDCFAPGDAMSRAMFATVLYRIAGKPETTEKPSFDDVAADRWFTDAIGWAVANNIVNGYGDRRFGPADRVTREQMAVLLWRYAGRPKAAGDVLSDYIDADKIGPWAKDAVAWAVDTGAIGGKGDGVFDPQGVATRAEAAQIVMNYGMKIK